MSQVAYVGTVLNVLAGVSLLLALVMALFWRARSAYPGFGMWAISNLLLAACCLVLANSGHFPTTVIVLAVPWIVVLAASLRLDGVGRFLWRARFDYRVLVLPVIALGLLCYFWFVRPNDLARALVAGGSIALLFAGTAGAMIPRGRRERSLFVMLFGVLFGLYAALLVSYGIFWAVGPGGLPLLELSKPNLAFGVLIVVFEIALVVILLTLGNWRETQRLQAAFKQVEDALGRTQLTVDFSNDQVFWLNTEGRFVFVADSTCRQLGYSREELLRMTIHDLDPTRSRDWQASWDTVKQGGSLTHEAVHRTKDGRDLPVEVNVNYICHDGQEYNLVFARDISERKRTEELLELSHEQARQNETMEAIGQLAGGIAHDFNNLLTAIIGYGNLILSNEEAHGVVSRDAEEIRAAAVRASALTHQILAFARRQTLRPQVVTLNHLVSATLPKLRQALGDEVEVITRLQSEPSHVEIDTAQFEQVLVNLAANSHDALPNGGRVIIEVRDVYLDEEYCRVYGDLRPGNYVLLSLADTGEGMSFETMGHIFEPFFTTKAPGSGSGLGLSTVYGIVRQSGGYINVYSEIDKGTTFKIYLPAVPARAEVEGGAPRAVEVVPATGSETVLVVEDEPPLRRLVARVLGGLGYTVFVAGSGAEALELLDDLDGSPDLLLTDVVLPGGMLGNQVAAAFIQRIPGLPVLYVSGHARDAIVHSGHLDEGVEFLGKPFTPESLAWKVREVLDAHSRRN